MPRIFLSPPHMGPDERELLLDAFDSNWVAPLGPHVDAFERELSNATGTEHCAALSSGTAALHLALLLLGVEEGDDVLVPTLTFAATVNAITYVRARPVLVDADPSTWMLDPTLVAQALEDRARSGHLPKALVSVDLYGQCCDYDQLQKVCNEYGVPIIQDAAEALGATYRGKPAGGQGLLGVLSFNGNKILTTGGGGALLSNRADFIEQARFLATQARDPAPHYEHSTIGYNYRLSNLLAAVGRGQLRHLTDRVAARRGNFEYYQRYLGNLPGWQFMPEAPYGTASRWLTCATIDPAVAGASREDVRLALARQDIEARPVWKPMHLQPVFADLPCIGGEVSRDLFEHGLCLPSGSSLRPSDLDRIVDIIRTTGRR